MGKGTMEELELQNTIMNRSVATVVKEKEESLMQHDILRLEVKRLRQQLNTKAESLYSLENRKQQLHISMEEREKEIEVHQEVLKAQLRSQEEERHRTAIELAERKQKIYNLKMKYENVLNKVKKEDGEEQHSQAYYVLKAAQANEVLFKKKKQLSQLQREEQEDNHRYEELQANLNKLASQVQELSAARDQLRLDSEAQRPKLERAEQALEVSRRRAVEAGVDMGQDAPTTLDVQTRTLRDQNQSVLYAMSNALQDHVEDVLPLFESLCNEKGLVRPSRPPSAASAGSRPGSSRLSSARSPPP